ncbi:MAG TPA: hypothetical protein VMA76_03270 [Solirubrobacteraceae bacterium]|nr:hypothetical protein [Solirubrobacteraceae bacterium]
MRSTRVLRGLGAVALLAVAAVHLYEYHVDHYSAIPTIGPLFLLNAASATALGLALIAPVQRLAPWRLGTVALPAIAAAGIGLAGTSLAALFVSESTPLFGFMEIGYRLVVVLAIAAEIASILVLGALLLTIRSTDRLPGPPGRESSPRPGTGVTAPWPASVTQARNDDRRPGTRPPPTHT